MSSNYWEEQDMETEVIAFHEEELGRVGLPRWVQDIVCPYCGRSLPLRSFRSIRFCLNTRNLGDIAVEVLCDECKMLDTVYFRERINSCDEFAELFVDKNKNMKSDPVKEKEMFKSMYNNVVEKMIVAQQV